MANSGHAGGHDPAHERRLGLDQRGDLGPVHVPLGAEREHELDAVEAGPVVGRLPVQLGEGVAVLAEAVTDEPGVEVVAVPDDQRTHTPTVPVPATGGAGERRSSADRRGSGPTRRSPSRRGHGRSLGDIRAARLGGPASPSTRPSSTSPAPVRAARARRRPQGREPAAHRRVQAPRGDEQGGLARRRGRQRGDGRQRRQPRPGARLRRPPLRRPVRHLRARRRADHQDRGVPGVRRRRSSSAAPRSTRPSPRPGPRPPSEGMAVLPPVRRPGRRRRAGHARTRARRRPRRPGVRRRPARRRRAGVGSAIAVKSQRPDVRVVGVQAAVCAPYAGGRVADRAGARRWPTASPSSARARSPARSSSGGSTTSSPSTRTPSPTRWCMLMDRAKLYVEGAGAVGVAAVQAGVVDPPARGTTCVVLSGGNVDLGVVPGLIRRHETDAGRRLVVFARIDDRPGSLVRLLERVRRRRRQPGRGRAPARGRRPARSRDRRARHVRGPRRRARPRRASAPCGAAGYRRPPGPIAPDGSLGRCSGACLPTGR